MKRFAAMLVVSVLVVLWIASGDRMSAGQRTDGLYYEVTGIHPDAVLMRINGEDISAEEYLYWLAYDCEYLTSYVPNLDFSAEVSNGMTYGSYAKGCIAGAVAIPTDGPAWQAMRLSRNRRWGHPDMIALIEQFSQDAQKLGWPGLLLGDISQPRGGPMLSGHASHQVGLDADIWFTPMPDHRLSA